MKNLLKIALAAALILSMTACGNGAQIDNNDPEDIQGGEISDITENETPEEPENPEETPKEPENPEETPDEPENQEPENPENEPEEPQGPAFDTAWASNNYEMLLPKPPFEGWSGKMKDTNVYELFTSEAKEGDSLSYYDVWQEYLDLLKSLGFSVEGEVYSSIAYDTMGNKFKLKCGDGCAWITFSPVEQLG